MFTPELFRFLDGEAPSPRSERSAVGGSPGECSCPRLLDLARLGLEGHTVPPCALHRPERGESARSLALNSDQLTAALGEPLTF